MLPTDLQSKVHLADPQFFMWHEWYNEEIFANVHAVIPIEVQARRDFENVKSLIREPARFVARATTSVVGRAYDDNITLLTPGRFSLDDHGAIQARGYDSDEQELLLRHIWQSLQPYSRLIMDPEIARTYIQNIQRVGESNVLAFPQY